VCLEIFEARDCRDSGALFQAWRACGHGADVYGWRSVVKEDQSGHYAAE